MENVTAGRDILGDFAPKFAELNDNVLFGQVWAREEQLSPRDRSVVTVTALMASGVLDTSLRAHIEIAKSNGITRDEWWRSLPTQRSTPDGPRPGRHSATRRRSTPSRFSRFCSTQLRFDRQIGVLRP